MVWGGRRVLPPLRDVHSVECWLLHYGPRKMDPPAGFGFACAEMASLMEGRFRGKALRPHDPVYKTSAFLCRPQENVKSGVPARNRTSSLCLRAAVCI